MAKSSRRDGTEPAVFVFEVAKQHDIIAGAIAFGVQWTPVNTDTKGTWKSAIRIIQVSVLSGLI